ncbi:MAG: murein biosynthesis integral membrane protein MurJ [Verrucomicrobia bacterium]|nr:MAG: murein biosynthesis integral membrane protein MurJ [Verrucomicrobiota bacterium]
MAEAADRQMSTRATGVVGIAILSSRVLGLIRETVFAGLFGAGKNLDAFLMAFRLPNLLRDLFAEGALSTAFITTFSKKIAIEGDQSAWRLGNKVATLTAVFMSAVTVLGIVFAPQLVDLLTWGSWSPDKTALTVLLTRIMWPFMLLVSLAALVMGMLNAKHVFGPPAMASSYFNLGSIIAGVAIGYWIDPHFGARSLVGLAIGTLIGGAWQLIGQFPSLWRVGYKFRPDFHWRDEGVRTVLTLMAPAVIAASAVQVNVLINSGFAASLGNGPVSWLNIAFRLMQLPLGIFGVAIGTVTLPLVSKHAALGNTAEFRAILARGMRLAFLLTIPSAIGLAMLAAPIISVIYQHGRFTAEMTRQTSGALQFYAIGLVSYAVLKVLTPAFYAIGKRNTPMVVSFLAIGANLFLNWFFTFRLGWGHRGLAFSTSLVATINFLLLYALMRRHTRRLETRQTLISLGKICLAGAALALVCWVANYWWLDAWASLRFFQKLATLLIAIALAAITFFAVAFWLRISEVQDIIDVFRSKFRRAL